MIGGNYYGGVEYGSLTKAETIKIIVSKAIKNAVILSKKIVSTLVTKKPNM